MFRHCDLTKLIKSFSFKVISTNAFYHKMLIKLSTYLIILSTFAAVKATLMSHMYISVKLFSPIKDRTVS